jgi:CheY-like chemotaxis protein
MTEAMNGTPAQENATEDAPAYPGPRPTTAGGEEALSEDKAEVSEVSELLEPPEQCKTPTESGQPSALFGLPSPPPLNPGTPSLAQEPSSQPIHEAFPAPATATGGLHVLLVDDNKINLQLLIMFMKKCGFTYTEAENGQEALDRYTEACIPASQTTGPGRQRFDFVLMDISMPVMDGLEATKRIREFERENAISAATIIALTGLASADAQRHAKSAGVDVFMPKPVRFAELRRLLHASAKEG